MHSFHRIRIFTSSHTHFLSPFRVCLRICGHDKSDPYGCERIAIMLLTDYDNAADGLQQRCEQIAIYTRTPTKYHTFAPQKPYFRTAKTILLHYKYYTFTPQKPYFCNANTHFLQRKKHTFTPQKTTSCTPKTYRRQIGRVAKTFC